MPYVTVPKVIEQTIHPFGQGAATTNGVQFSAVAQSNTNTVIEVVVESKAFNVWPFGSPGGAGKFVELEVGLTGQARTGANCDLGVVTYGWQGKNLEPLNVSWYQIVANTVTANHINDAWQEYTHLGRVAPVAGFNAVPFEVRFVVSANIASNAFGRTKNSSYIHCKYPIA